MKQCNFLQKDGIGINFWKINFMTFIILGYVQQLSKDNYFTTEAKAKYSLNSLNECCLQLKDRYKPMFSEKKRNQQGRKRQRIYHEYTKCKETNKERNTKIILLH